MTPDAPQGGALVPFPAEKARKGSVPDNEPRGHILFFTGVRYERMAEPSLSPKLGPKLASLAQPRAVRAPRKRKG